jgi:hypothetical protein
MKLREIWGRQSGQTALTQLFWRQRLSSNVSISLGVMTESSSHMRDDDVFLQEHSAHPVNT